ncbi:unnamed protein product [Rhizoctonia solani]|uniref:AMP-dependent synthetase/ligase domain-containing protein n=1 Tax=Rhizoctonia solani TaxID=456999 RepID=A0A8H3GVI5_9AGAM|nr:unnamed protein product [Rhizoctonia solani]
MVVLPPSFVFPPTDGSIPPALAIDFHHRNNPRHIFAILYHAGEPSQSITYEQLAYAVHRVAYTLNPDNKIPQGTNIGLLISASSLEYIVLFLGAMRAGLVPFPISPRVHLPGIAHLLTTTKTSLVVTGGSDAIYNTTAQLAEILESNFEVEFVKLSALRDTLSFTADESSETRFKSFPALETMGYNSIVTILHSSGSTGMPKAIKCHLEGVFKNVINQPLLWTLSEPNSIVGTMTLPTFHCMGLNLQVLAPLYTGYTQVLFAPSRIPAVPTPASTLEAITSISCTFLICVPVFLEAWAHDEEAIAVLKSIKRVIFGGGPLTDEIGNKLIDRGIRMFSGYGATEFGIVTLAPDDHAKDWPWNYLKFSPHLKTHFIPQNDQDNAFELVFEAGEDHSPFVLNSELNGKAVYRTRDLLVPHPTKSNVWKFVGRVDDQIVLLNGEKTNPGPMEAEIVKCPLVRGAIMFGQARNQTGALIELKESPSGSTFDIEDDRRELIGALWPYIESANRTSSTHSRLDKRALIFVDPSRPLPRTPKGTIPRAAAWKLYANEIDAMYAALEQNIDADALPEFQPPETWADPVVVSAWITERAEDILGWDVDPTADLFQQGMDRPSMAQKIQTLNLVARC